jgi:hypothetical protein
MTDLLPGWTCPICLTFNGEVKDVVKTCRHCDSERSYSYRDDLFFSPKAIGVAIRNERRFILNHLRAQRDHLLPNNPTLAAHYGILADEIESLPTKLRSPL